MAKMVQLPRTLSEILLKSLEANELAVQTNEADVELLSPEQLFEDFEGLTLVSPEQLFGENGENLFLPLPAESEIGIKELKPPEELFEILNSEKDNENENKLKPLESLIEPAKLMNPSKLSGKLLSPEELLNKVKRK